MRVGVAGKTGSGKTTVSALVAMAAAARGHRVIAVDTDTSPNLALSLGLGHEGAARVRVVPRALARGRGGGGVTAAQVLAGFGVETPAGVTLLHAMQGGAEAAGCACPAHASARSVLAEALDGAGLAVIDMEAGLDHLDRTEGTLAHVDTLLLVVEPSRKSSLVAGRLVERARTAGLQRLRLVGTKAQGRQDEDDATFIAAVAEELGVPLAGIVPFSPAVVDADRTGAGLSLGDGHLRQAVEAIVDEVESTG